LPRHRNRHTLADAVTRYRLLKSNCRNKTHATYFLCEEMELHRLYPAGYPRAASIAPVIEPQMMIPSAALNTRAPTLRAVSARKAFRHLNP
jgi:hypothetical protein